MVFIVEDATARQVSIFQNIVFLDSVGANALNGLKSAAIST